MHKQPEQKPSAVKRLSQRFLADIRGATAIEYALICGLIFLAVVTSINTFTTKANLMYNKIESNMK